MLERVRMGSGLTLLQIPGDLEFHQVEHRLQPTGATWRVLVDERNIGLLAP